MNRDRKKARDNLDSSFGDVLEWCSNNKLESVAVSTDLQGKNFLR